VPGTHLTDQQIRLYMNERNEGQTQTTAAAKAGVSERTGRRIDTGELSTQSKPRRQWSTRKDPLAGIWQEVLVPLLEVNPELLPLTLLEYLDDNYPHRYDETILRTLQRRVRSWKAQHGPSKEVIFRQKKVPARLGLSDFTTLKNATITLRGELFTHILYHYRLAFSGWCHVKVICGGESFTALSTGLQDAFWRSGGTPLEHRTDSLSAAFNNHAEEDQLTTRYHAVCQHYGVKATRNNRGVSHENGAIESPHGHLKKRIKQALLLRGSEDFLSLEDYQIFIDGIVSKINRKCHTRFQEERACLQDLPKRRTQDYAEHQVLISSSSTFDLKRATYSVPSRFIGERLYVQLFDERLTLFHGHEEVLALKRVYATKTQRIRNIDYRHLIDSLVRKPQAFRFSNIRDDLLPSLDYQRIWEYVDDTLPAHKACSYIVRILHLASQKQCEGELGRYIVNLIEKGELPSELQCSKRFGSEATSVPIILEKQHTLADYDQLLTLASLQQPGVMLYV
jgi:transposase InsO family protein